MRAENTCRLLFPVVEVSRHRALCTACSRPDDQGLLCVSVFPSHKPQLCETDEVARKPLNHSLMVFFGTCPSTSTLRPVQQRRETNYSTYV